MAPFSGPFDFAALFFSFEGRISRTPYWLASVILIATSFVISGLGGWLGNERLADVLSLALLYPDTAVNFKRAHDREMPYTMLLINLALSMALIALSIFGLANEGEQHAPLFWAVAFPSIAVGLYLMVELGFRKGVSGPNQFGPDPLQRI